MMARAAWALLLATASAIAQRGVGGALDEDHGHDW
jgi:hypothetical protein